MISTRLEIAILAKIEIIVFEVRNFSIIGGIHERLQDYKIE